MPVEYTLDAGHGLIHTRLIGEVDAEAVRGHFETLLAEPALPDRLFVLMDAMEMTTVPTLALIHTTGEQVARVRRRVHFEAVAIAVPGLAQYGMFRMGQVLLESSFGRTHVFRDVDSARSWLMAQGNVEA